MFSTFRPPLPPSTPAIHAFDELAQAAAATASLNLSFDANAAYVPFGPPALKPTIFRLENH
jgi:hypothetical protein